MRCVIRQPDSKTVECEIKKKTISIPCIHVYTVNALAVSALTNAQRFDLEPVLRVQLVIPRLGAGTPPVYVPALLRHPGEFLDLLLSLEAVVLAKPIHVIHDERLCERVVREAIEHF